MANMTAGDPFEWIDYGDWHEPVTLRRAEVVEVIDGVRVWRVVSVVPLGPEAEKVARHGIEECIQMRAKAKRAERKRRESRW